MPFNYLEIFNNETFYRQKLTKNLSLFTSIFENYITILEELKKIKFSREHEESKTNAYQSFINNLNLINPTFSNSFGKEDSATLKINCTNLNKSIEHETYRNLTEVEEEFPENSNFKTNNTRCELKSKSKNHLFNQLNTNQIHSGAGTKGFSNNIFKKVSTNLVKSISRRPSTLQNNITFCNYGLFKSKQGNSYGLENSLAFANNINNSNANYNFVCSYCNNVNSINYINNSNNVNNNGNNLNSSQIIPPFKLMNNTNLNTNSEVMNTETLNYKSNSPIKKTLSADLFSKIDSTEKKNFFTKDSNGNQNFFNEIHLLKNIEKSPDKDLIANLKHSVIFHSNKPNFVDLNQINSINNTPVGVKSFNLTSPNNLGSNVNINFNYMNANNIFYNNINHNNHYLLTSEREKPSIGCKYEILRQSVLSNSSNRKINEDCFYFSEFKILRKESLLYRSFFDSMTNEISNFKFYEKNKEEALDKFYDENRVIFEKEVTCFWKALKVYKEIFVDQIKIKENKINEMSKVFDDMVIGENSILMGNNLNLFGGNKDNFQINKFF
jgi:hypothetical protein